MVNFIKCFDTDGYVPTAAMSEVVVESDTDDKLAVSVARIFGHSSITVFSADLYPHDGRLSLHELGELVEADMRLIESHYADYCLTIGDQSKKFSAVYCSFAEIPLNPSSDFLLSAKTIPCFADSLIRLNSIPTDSPVKIVMHVGSDAGYRAVELALEEGMLSSGTWGASLPELMKSIEAEALNAVAFFVGGRFAYFYVLPGTPDIRFAFANAYNAVEYLDLRAVVKEKLEVKADSAVCAGITSQYNRRAEKLYEVSPAVISNPMLSSLEQLVSSHRIAVCVSGTWHPVIITDSSFEPSNDNADFPSVKFTFRFVNRQPFHFLAPLLDHFKAPADVFTNQFNYSFT